MSRTSSAQQAPCHVSPACRWMWSGLSVFTVEYLDLVGRCLAIVLSEFMLSPMPGQADCSKNTLYLLGRPVHSSEVAWSSVPSQWLVR